MSYLKLNICMLILLFSLMSTSQKLYRRMNPSCPYDVCDNSFNYPVEEVNEVLDNNKMYRYANSYFGMVATPEPNNHAAHSTDGIRKNMTICPIKVITTYPLSLKNMQDVNYTIINTYKMQQGIQFHICESFQKCNIVHKGNFDTCCVQKFINLPLLVLVPKNHRHNMFQMFKVPSTCACSYQRRRP